MWPSKIFHSLAFSNLSSFSAKVFQLLPMLRTIYGLCFFLSLQLLVTHTPNEFHQKCFRTCSLLIVELNFIKQHWLPIPLGQKWSQVEIWKECSATRLFLKGPNILLVCDMFYVSLLAQMGMKTSRAWIGEYCLSRFLCLFGEIFYPYVWQLIGAMMCVCTSVLLFVCPSCEEKRFKVGLGYCVKIFRTESFIPVLLYRQLWLLPLYASFSDLDLSLRSGSSESKIY